MKYIRRTALLFVTLLSFPAVAEKAATDIQLKKSNDDYYSDNLDAAVEEARKRTHHYDYSSTLRYERTTSQSIQFPRLLNTELETTAVESLSLGATAAGNTDALDEADEYAISERQNSEPEAGLSLTDRLREGSYTQIESAPDYGYSLNGVSISVQAR